MYNPDGTEQKGEHMPKQIFIDLTNKIFGKLKVIKLHEIRKRHTIWECDCECGNKCFTSLSNLRRKTIHEKSCGCICKDRGQNTRNNRWKGYGDISGRFWYSIKRNAQTRNIPYNISIEYAWNLYLKQDRKCAITGLTIDLKNSGNKRNATMCSASLDRIDSSKGYVEGNVWWVNKKINQIKMDLNVEDFICICNIVANKNYRDNKTIQKFSSKTDWIRLRYHKSRIKEKNEPQ